MEGFRKSHKSEHYFDEDIALEFKKRYLANPTESVQRSNKAINVLLPLLDDIHRLNLTSTIEDYINKNQVEYSLDSAESYIVEAIEAAMAPIDDQQNKPRPMSKEPIKFVKPITLSKLRKILKKNPEYFK